MFESNEYKTIAALVLKIEDDISHWGKSLSIKDRAIYNTNRDLLEERLNDVERQIRSRTPTNWEKLKNFFSKFIDFVLEHLPKIWNGLRIAAKTLSNVKGLEWLGKGVNAIDKTIGKFINTSISQNECRTRKNGWLFRPPIFHRIPQSILPRLLEAGHRQGGANPHALAT